MGTRTNRLSRKNQNNNAPVANPAATHSAGLTATHPNTVNPGSNTSTPLTCIITDVTVPTTVHAQSQITKGKIEETIGKIVGSRNMMMKGNAKIEQGEAEKTAAGHLIDADRLENEAAEKRHMAGVGRGVHTSAGNVGG